MAKLIKRMLIIILPILVLIVAMGYPKKPIKGNKIAIIFTIGGLGDKSFNDLCYDGMLKAQKELGIDFDYSEPKTSDEYESISRKYAEDNQYGLIITVGYEQEESIKKIAKEFPNKKFIMNDSKVELPNVVSINERWSEQIFINGVIAGLAMKDNENLKKENVVGIILGKDSEQIRGVANAFEAGVKYVNPQSKVISAVVNSFSDPGRAMEIALLMYNSKGVNFIQHIAGASGLGVFAAAGKSDKYAFGVDGNENHFEPDNIVSTAIRRINYIMFEELKAFVKGQWNPGIHEYGIENDFIIHAREGSKVEILKETMEKAEEIKNKIINKEINISTLIK